MKVTEKRLLDIKETAKLLGISPNTIYNKCCRSAKDKFPIKPKRIGKLLRWDINDINRYIDRL
jgi:predicted DNA-binding transcriptional regulator AlpA